ncbi:hypothetical protein IWW43_003021, partial [Coemansia sp. RSA 1935]
MAQNDLTTTTMRTPIGDSNSAGDRGVRRLKVGGAALFAAHASLAEPFGPNEPYWLLDSGASISVCNDAQAFTSITPKNGKIHTINGNIGIHGRGTATHGNIEVENVLHAPRSKLNLLSVSHLVPNNMQVLFGSSGAYVYKNGKA